MRRAPWQADEALKWNDLHREFFRAKQLRYPPNPASTYSGEQMEILAMLPKRCQDIVIYYDLVSPLRAGSLEECLDLSQGIDRMKPVQDMTPCILPRSILSARKAFRIIEPNEKLHLQGLPLFTKYDLAGFSSAELSDLSGNAFCGQNLLSCLMWRCDHREKQAWLCE